MLVIRIGRLGDTIMATPVIEVLQQAFGGGVMIDFVASPGASTAILELDRRVNQVFPVDRRRLPWRLHPVKRMLRKRSRSMPYDLVINLECGTECDDFIEFIKTGEFCGRPLVHPQHIPGRHCVDTEKTIYAHRLGPEITAAADPSLDRVPDSERLSSIGGADYIVLNPGFSGILKSGYRSHRSWPVEYWADLIGSIRQGADVDIAINGTGEEREHFEPLLSLPGVISLFGPTIPELTGPYSKKVPFSVLRSGIDCQPCLLTGEQKKCTFNRCMHELAPQKVHSSVERMMLMAS